MKNDKCEECGEAIVAGTMVNFDTKAIKWECPHCGFWSRTHIEPTAEDKAFEVIERKQECNKTHPLLNPDSKHYSMVDDVEAIARMEQMYSKEELAVWAKITAMKYRLRIGNKEDVTKESKKIETYEAYYTYLKEKLDACRD